MKISTLVKVASELISDLTRIFFNSCPVASSLFPFPYVSLLCKQAPLNYGNTIAYQKKWRLFYFIPKNIKSCISLKEFKFFFNYKKVLFFLIK